MAQAGDIKDAGNLLLSPDVNSLIPFTVMSSNKKIVLITGMADLLNAQPKANRT